VCTTAPLPSSLRRMLCAPPRAASDLSLAEALARELQDLGVFMALCSCTGQRHIPPGCLLPVAERVRPAMPFRPNAHAGAGGMLRPTRLGPRTGGSDDRPAGKGPSVGDEERGSRPRALGPPRQMAQSEGGPVGSGRRWRAAPRLPTRHRVNPRTMVFDPFRSAVSLPGWENGRAAQRNRGSSPDKPLGL